MRTVRRDIVGGVLVSQDEKILLGYSRGGGVYPGKLCIPGGGVEEGETYEEALIREIMEETGIDIADSKTVLFSDDQTGSSQKTLDSGEEVIVQMRFFNYEITLSQNSFDIEIQEEDDIVDLAWYSMSDLAEAPLSPPTVDLFTRMGILGN